MCKVMVFAVVEKAGAVVMSDREEVSQLFITDEIKFKILYLTSVASFQCSYLLWNYYINLID